MRAIQGALIVSSSLQIILGYSQLWGLFTRLVLKFSSLISLCLIGALAWYLYLDCVHLNVLPDSLVL